MTPPSTLLPISPSLSPPCAHAQYRDRGEGTIGLRFATAPNVSNKDAERLALEISYGIHVAGALPWISIESTNDRNASRIVSLHPVYQHTLVGFVFTELDTALKAVGGTARGGLFLDTDQRDAFLHNVCLKRDWGPNGQAILSPAIGTVEKIRKFFPSFTLSDAIFQSPEVSEWRQRWEAVWKGDTGMDIQGQLQHIDLFETSNSGCSLVSATMGSSRTPHHVLQATPTPDVHADVFSGWGVAIHEDGADANEDEGARAQRTAVRVEGEDLCRRLLPTVPIPAPPTTSQAPSGRSGTAEAWRPPKQSQARPTLEYLFQLLNVITGLVSVLETARAELPEALPSHLTARVLHACADGRGGGSLFGTFTGKAEACCVTPPRIPFEPAIDRESGGVFLGGGVGLKAAPRDVLRRKRATSARSLGGGGEVVVTFARPKADVAAALASARDRLAPVRRRFTAQVAVLGLWSNYEHSHPWEGHPRDTCRQDDSLGLAGGIRAVLPDGYCRRTRKSWAEAATDVLGREDVRAQLLQARVAGDKEGSGGGGDGQAAGPSRHSPAPAPFPPPVEVKERVQLFNGDVYEGGWSYGRRHGRGVYFFASGARYEGEWRDGNMVGWGVYITPEGQRNNIRH